MKSGKSEKTKKTKGDSGKNPEKEKVDVQCHGGCHYCNIPFNDFGISRKLDDDNHGKDISLRICTQFILKSIFYKSNMESTSAFKSFPNAPHISIFHASKL